MNDGRRLFVYARVRSWEKQCQDITRAIKHFVDDREVVPEYLSNELRRLAWLINHGRAELGMTRTMYDSTDPNLIPDTAQIVCYYPHAWGSDMTKHHNALQVRIDNRGDHADDCHVLDVESGAASVNVAREWVQSWHKLHPGGMHMANGWCRKPVLYCSSSLLSSLRGACAGEDYDIWAAQWDGSESPIAGCFARQYVNHGPAGENYDMSLVYDDTWGHEPTPAPTPAPVPQPATTQAGVVVWWTGNAYHEANIVTSDGGKTWHQ